MCRLPRRVSRCQARENTPIGLRARRVPAIDAAVSPRRARPGPVHHYRPRRASRADAKWRRGAPRRSPGASCTGRARRRTTPACAPPRRTACGTRGQHARRAGAARRDHDGGVICGRWDQGDAARDGQFSCPHGNGWKWSGAAGQDCFYEKIGGTGLCGCKWGPSSCSAATTATSARPASAPAVRSGRRRSSCRAACSGRPRRGRATAALELTAKHKTVLSGGLVPALLPASAARSSEKLGKAAAALQEAETVQLPPLVTTPPVPAPSAAAAPEAAPPCSLAEPSAAQRAAALVSRGGAAKITWNRKPMLLGRAATTVAAVDGGAAVKVTTASGNVGFQLVHACVTDAIAKCKRRWRDERAAAAVARRQKAAREFEEERAARKRDRQRGEALRREVAEAAERSAPRGKKNAFKDLMLLHGRTEAEARDETQQQLATEAEERKLEKQRREREEMQTAAVSISPYEAARLKRIAHINRMLTERGRA